MFNRAAAATITSINTQIPKKKKKKKMKNISESINKKEPKEKKDGRRPLPLATRKQTHQKHMDRREPTPAMSTSDRQTLKATSTFSMRSSAASSNGQADYIQRRC